MTTAGLDLSLTSAGVAFIRQDGSHQSASFGYGLKKGASERQKLTRLVYVVNEVMGALRKEGVSEVGIENYGFASHTLAFSAELGGNVRLQVWAGLKIMPLILPPMSVRKFILGKATKDKKLVHKALTAKGFTGMANFDESDAMAVAYMTRFYFHRRSEASTAEHLKLLARLDLQRRP